MQFTNKCFTCLSRALKLLILTTLVQSSDPSERVHYYREREREREPWGSYGASLRFLSSHGDDHLSKDEVIERVLAVIKSFPKVDPSQVSPSFSLFHFLEKIPVWFATKQFFYVSDFAPQINKLFLFFLV